MPRVPVPAYILAGGRSTRFGTDKARAAIGGTMLILRVARAVRPIASQVIAVADRPRKYADLGLPTIADRIPHLGPMGGLLAAVRHSRSPWLMLVSCDLVSVNPQWVLRMLNARYSGAQAVAFRDGGWQPMPGLYHKSLGGLISRHIAAGELAMWKLLEHCRSVALPVPADWPAVAQINTREDLERVVLLTRGERARDVRPDAEA